MIKVFGTCAVAILIFGVLGAAILAPGAVTPLRQSGPIGAARWDGSKHAPDCSHLAWRDYDNACGYGVQWPGDAAHK